MVLVGGVGAGLGCTKADTDGQKPAPSATLAAAETPVSAAALAKAEGAAKKLGGTLKQKLMGALGSGSAAQAVEVCAGEAQALVAQVRKETGVRVGRSSLRLRNEADAPPEWVGAWLKAQGERKAEGALGIHAVVETKEGKVARVLVPIAVEAPCILCHGDPAAIAPEVKGAIEARYPKDAATGYQVGDLRGALWAEAVVGE